MKLETIVECDVCELDVEHEGGVAYCRECWDEHTLEEQQRVKLLARFLRHHLEGTVPDALFIRHVREALPQHTPKEKQ